MRIGVIGPGRIGGNCARQALKAGHEVTLSFSRDAVGVPRLELHDLATLRWQSGLG